MEGDSSGSVAG